MDMNDIFALMDRFDASAATGLELEMAGVRLKLERGTQAAAPAAAAAPVAVAVAAPAAPAPAAPVSADYIKAPLVGTFYQAAAPDKAPYVSVGDTVKKGQTVCVLEAMKMMSEVPAPVDCVIEEILASDGELVGFDGPLFRVRLV